MKITISIQGSLKPNQSTQKHIEVSPGSTVARAVKELDLPGNLPFISLVNGKLGAPTQELFEGDEVVVYLQPFAGG